MSKTRTGGEALIPYRLATYDVAWYECSAVQVTRLLYDADLPKGVVPRTQHDTHDAAPAVKARGSSDRRGKLCKIGTRMYVRKNVSPWAEEADNHKSHARRAGQPCQQGACASRSQ
jgi:hypothetical protein